MRGKIRINRIIYGIMVLCMTVICFPAMRIQAETSATDRFASIIIDANTNKMNVDGQQESFSKEFNLTYSQAKKELSSASRLESYLNENDASHIYEVEAIDSDSYQVTAPYQNKQIILEEGNAGQMIEELKQSDVDAEIVSYEVSPYTGYTTVTFASEEDTRDALENLQDTYGDDSCVANEVLYANLMEVDGSTQTTESVIRPVEETVSWGSAFLGMEDLKYQYKQRSAPKEVLVAVIDTGVDKTSSIVKNRISTLSYNFVTKSKTVTDKDGHGTHVCGIIADATPDNVKIMALKIMDTEGSVSLNTVLNAISYAIEKKSCAINMSLCLTPGLGSEKYFKDTVQKSMDKLFNKAYIKGIPVCAAAGNESASVSKVYPASNKKVWAISSISERGLFSSFSNYGSLIDFAAPGEFIRSAKKGGGLESRSGTSMASPHIVAEIAYIKMMQSNLSVTGVKNELKRFCIDLGVEGKDSFYGYGCPMIANLLKKGLKYKTDITTPTLETVKNVSGGISITWAKVSAATSYHIYRKTGSGSYKKLASVSSSKTSYTDKNTSNGKSYTYKILPINNGQSGSYSGTKTMYRITNVGSVKVQNKANKKIYVQWGSKKSITGYEVQVSVKNTFKDPKTFSYTTSKKSITLKDYEKQKYYIRVRAYKKVNKVKYYSAWSSTKALTVKK